MENEDAMLETRRNSYDKINNDSSTAFTIRLVSYAGSLRTVVHTAITVVL